MRAKLINNEILYAPNQIQQEIDGNMYTTYNPTDKMLAELGWLPLVYTDMPNNAINGYHYEVTYTEQNNEIVQDWELVEDPEISDEISDAEALAIILGGGI